MSLKWTGSESGILRKSEFKEKKEELFVFGYSCKLFRDDDKALLIDQGKHLIPWMGDETLKIDRYDARGALHDLSPLEAPPGGYDLRMELTRTELEVEQLCDEERYRAMHTDEDEEEMYKEEELKRLHAAGYGQVGFNYDTPKEPDPPSEPLEADEPFLPTPSFMALLPPGTVVPETDKQNAIIEKTAKFIATQGAQMEILIKAKQGDNPQFRFLNRDSTLHPYYTVLIALVKAGKWPEKKAEVVEEKPHENEEYLHPSLAATIIESAPSIPSIHYKPSADCDYRLLVSRVRGTEAEPPAPGEEPPGTAPLPPRPAAEIQRAPVMYGKDGKPAEPQLLAPPLQPTSVPRGPVHSTGLSLMKNYASDSDSEDSDIDDASSSDSKEKDKPKPTETLPRPAIPIATPPEDVQVVIDKMALYVSRNGADFADIVRAKRDPRFSFLEPTDQYHAWYARALKEKLGGDGDSNKAKAPVSFSIKKMKEPDPILPKPALPYESSSDEDSESKQTDKADEKPDPPKSNIPPIIHTNMAIPQAVVYKMEATHENNLPTVKALETIKYLPKPAPILAPIILEKPPPVERPPEVIVPRILPKPDVAKVERNSPERKSDKIRDKESRDREMEKVKDRERSKDCDIPRKDKKKYKDKRKDHITKDREKRSMEREKKKDKEFERIKKSRKYSKDELENDIISLEDNSDDMIDLTGDQSDTKAPSDACPSAEAVLASRRSRAAEFLRRCGAAPAASDALARAPAASLASAMVETLESLRKKKAEEEEKRRKREKRRHREKHGHEDNGEKGHRKCKRRKYRSSEENDESDYDSAKKKKRKKEKRRSRKHRPRAGSPAGDLPLPPDLDLSQTLRELRNASPTDHLVLQDVEDTQHSTRQDSSSDDEEVTIIRKKKKKEDREYSEGEWSSDSEEDSTESKNGQASMALLRPLSMSMSRLRCVNCAHNIVN